MPSICLAIVGIVLFCGRSTSKRRDSATKLRRGRGLMPMYVVRHAKAGDRAEWEGHDRLRPLSKSGRRQAEELAAWLKKEPIHAILSSEYVRCVQTVEPLADQHKLPVVPRKDLEEGAGGESIFRMVSEFEGRNVVLCTHGDVVEE